VLESLASPAPVRVLPPLSLIREVLQAAAPGAVDLALGEPGHAPPPAALAAMRDAAAEALEARFSAAAAMRYTPNAGLPELRAAVAQSRPFHGDAASVLITVGSQEALALVSLGLLAAGDEVLIPDLAYPSYEALPALAGARVRRAAWDRLEDSFSAHTRLVIVGSPSNPTGAVLSAARLAALAEQAALCGAWILLDEIYAPLFDAAFAPRPASAAERVLLVGGVSKAFALTGLRVGWLVAPPEVVARLLPVHQHLVTCAPRPAQQAALAALASGDGTPAGARELYAALRRRAIAGLGAIGGLRVDDPLGGYYLWVDARARLGLATHSFALDAARAGSVLVVPGEAFGPAGAGYLRLSVAAGEAAVDAGMARLARALAGGVA